MLKAGWYSAVFEPYRYNENTALPFTLCAINGESDLLVDIAIAVHAVSAKKHCYRL